MRSSGNNDNSVILFGHHAGLSSLLQCLGRLSQPIAPSLCSDVIGVTAALGIAVWPIYQRGARTKSHYCINIRRTHQVLTNLLICCYFDKIKIFFTLTSHVVWLYYWLYQLFDAEITTYLSCVLDVLCLTFV